MLKLFKFFLTLPQKFCCFVLFAVVIFLVYLGFHYYPNVQKFLFPLDYKETILKYSKQYNLPPSLVASLIYNESHFNPNAKSKAGAIGLMQIMPTTGNWIAVKLNEPNYSFDKLKNESVNIKFGCWYLRFLLDRFDQNIDLTLAAYNLGTKKIDEIKGKNLKENLPQETFLFIEKVKKVQKIYQKLYNLD